MATAWKRRWSYSHTDPAVRVTFSYLAVVTRKDGALRNQATTPIGDRVQVRSARIDGGRLLVSAVSAGAGDAACCPGDLVDWEWMLGDGRLNLLSTVRTGRLSPATLAGTTWVLRAWDITEPAGAEPVVSLAFDAGRFTGSSGCNRYVASVEGGTTPGEVKVGPLAGTRMACPEPSSSVEARFLEQLADARTFGFLPGRLAISYTRREGSTGTMLFQASAPFRAVSLPAEAGSHIPTPNVSVYRVHWRAPRSEGSRGEPRQAEPPHPPRVAGPLTVRMQHRGRRARGGTLHAECRTGRRWAAEGRRVRRPAGRPTQRRPARSAQRSRRSLC